MDSIFVCSFILHSQKSAGLPFTPAPRETEADATGNVKTRDRQLKERVYLAVKTDAEGNKSGSRWTLPSAIAQNDETLLATAERAVSEALGKDLTLWCPSNAPMTVNFRVYNKHLPEEFRMNYYGEKIFYYRVQYDSGDVDEGALKADDYAWLTREEMTERVEEERGKHQAKFFHYML
jgi:large subunit ribosomal protein L46